MRSLFNATLMRQGSSYLLVGLVQLLLDWGVFVAATALGMPTPFANLLGRVSGALLGFWLNGRLTFAIDGQARLGRKNFARFLLVWLSLTFISTWLVSHTALELGLRASWMAKPLVEAGLALVSFFLLRHFVYR
ncbi:MAG TPA: GtrA family protein [Pseudoxanthomonas sp.]